MGVQNLQRLLRERYPDFEFPFTENLRYDQLFLDLYQVIYFFVNDQKKSKTDIFKSVSQYIDNLVKLVKPRSLLFIALEGQPPIAKERRRRLRQNLNKSSATSIVSSKPNSVTTTEVTRSNIHHDSVFIKEFQHYLKKFINHKMQKEDYWMKIRVILNGDNCPGEGEHKIFDYIRYQRNKPNYDPSTVHCIYGFDSDIIMLSLVSHEANIIVLQENVENKNLIDKCGSKESFRLFDISILRRYIDIEFSSLKSVLKTNYDLNKIINDFVFMTFLCGNDFVPHIVSLSNIYTTLPILIKYYKEVMISKQKYLTDKGLINVTQFLQFIDNLLNEENKHLQQLMKPTKSNNIKAYIKQYHNSKMKKTVNDNDIKVLAESYLTTLQWIMICYVYRVPDWSFLYQHKYGPFINDFLHLNLKNISEKLEFQLDDPKTNPIKCNLTKFEMVDQRVRISRCNYLALRVDPKQATLSQLPGVRPISGKVNIACRPINCDTPSRDSSCSSTSSTRSRSPSISSAISDELNDQLENEHQYRSNKLNNSNTASKYLSDYNVDWETTTYSSSDNSESENVKK